jgi:DNA polymerase (family 10)
METVGDLDFIVSATEIAPVVEWFAGLPGVQEVTARGETKTSVRFVDGLQADLRIVPDDQFIFALHHFTGSKDHNVQMRQRALARGLSLSEWGLTPVETGDGGRTEDRRDRKTVDGGRETGKPRPEGGDLRPEGGNRKTVDGGRLTADGGTAAGGGKRTPGRGTSSVAKRAAGEQRTAVAVGAASQSPGYAPVTVSSEADLFARLGLHAIPPELREGLGEIEAAEKSELPRLVELGDLRGTFHCHTTASDGRNTLAEMATAAASLGWEYLGIADHSKSSIQANGLTEERLLAQIEAIRDFNASGGCTTHLFAGTECDILPDGRLDFDEAVLARLDYVVASVHSTFAQDEATMTARLIRAIEHPCTTMLGHLTGRLLLRREAYKVDVGRVIDAAIANRVIIEINAAPKRLDMDWRHWRKAAERGLLCAINPDAHETGELGYVRAGINAARKGWLTKDQVVNTRSRSDVEKVLRARRSTRAESGNR